MKSWKFALIVFALWAVVGSSMALYFRLENQTLRKQLAGLRSERSTPQTGAPSSLSGIPETTAEDYERRIRALEAELRDARTETPKPAQDTTQLIEVVAEQAPSRPEPRPRNRENWLDNLKQQDPQRYQDIMERQDRVRKAMNDAFAQKAAHFLNRDPERMSEEEAAEYNEMLDLLTRTWKLADQLRLELPRDERMSAMRDLRETVTTLTPMLAAKRDREFYYMGRDLGYSEEEAVNFVDYINNMIEITSMGPVYRSLGAGFGRGSGPRSRTQ